MPYVHASISSFFSFYFFRTSVEELQEFHLVHFGSQEEVQARLLAQQQKVARSVAAEESRLQQLRKEEEARSKDREPERERDGKPSQPNLHPRSACYSHQQLLYLSLPALLLVGNCTTSVQQKFDNEVPCFL